MPKLPREACGLVFHGGSGDSSVLVDHAAEDPLPADRSVEWDDGRRVVVGWAVSAALAWSVVVEVSGVLVEDGRGVALVVDEDSVGAFGSDAADEPFVVAVGAWCSVGSFTASMPPRRTPRQMTRRIWCLGRG